MSLKKATAPVEGGQSAAAPDRSVWVSASAGTGKTKILTDRILRLLLPGPEGREASPAHKILCLTFTKAGASEMALRLQERLRQWAVWPERAEDGAPNLTQALRDLLGYEPEAADLEAARRLFTEVTDTPGGIKIMTIHAFCQSVLGRFSLEAGMPAAIKILDEPAFETLLHKVLRNVFTPEQSAGAHEDAFLERLAGYTSFKTMEVLSRLLSGERRQIEILMRENFGADGFYTRLCGLLGIRPGWTADDILHEACASGAQDTDRLRNLSHALRKAGGSKAQAAAAGIAAWVQADIQKRIASFQNYADALLTREGAPRALMTKAIEAHDPQARGLLEREQERIQKVFEDLRRARCALATADLMRGGQLIIDFLQNEKSKAGAWDYDDLIFKTVDLLEGRCQSGVLPGTGAWILYKLDQGIDHILVDEAQDTNPEQWSILKLLAEEFYAGLGASDAGRSLFVVGDAKQSIYSFQRASAEDFYKSHSFFREKFLAAQQIWQDADLQKSFRSTPSVLEFVDSVFSFETARRGVASSPVFHQSNRPHQAGLVELWPLAEEDETQLERLWDAPFMPKNAASAQDRLVEQLATRIETMLAEDDLPSRGRPVQPGDILILLRTRGALADKIARALRRRSIPVSGADRLKLHEHIAVQDLLSFAEFTLAPGDDLNLACLLKSPFIGLSEEELFDLCDGRADSLWHELQQRGPDHEAVYDYLKKAIQTARAARPYDFLTYILNTPCPAEAQGGFKALRTRLGEDVQDPIYEFLRMALDFENRRAVSLQDFVHIQKSQKTDIKRDLDHQERAVRIMTVHGAKGLQAPIVLLPDTIRTSRSMPATPDSRLIWPKESGLALPLWSPGRDSDCEAFLAAQARLREKQEEEYKRLLYVALTRAEDRLYIGGYRGRMDPAPRSWYYLAEAGLKALPGARRMACGSWRIENTQNGPPDRRDPERPSTAMRQARQSPDWAKMASAIKQRPVVLRPSALKDGEKRATEGATLEGDIAQAGLSPARGAVLHGILVHGLMDHLIPLTPAQRQKAAEAWLDRHKQAPPPTLRAAVTEEVMRILRKEDLQFLFAPPAKDEILMTEVPVAGRTAAGEILSGRIDFVKITANKLYIVDYKTGAGRKSLPGAYQAQLRAYARIMQSLYPAKTAHAAVLWTKDARLLFAEPTPEPE